jgi:hypothetical protein
VQLFYAADDSTVGDTPLYRLLRSSPGDDEDDHMVSTDPTEGAPTYALEGELAVGWSSRGASAGFRTVRPRIS